MEFIHIIRLLVKEQAVWGAVGLDVKGNRTIVFRAGAVILAAGGGGHIFAQTNNTADVTGDCYALAVEAGATLRDMEFVQYFPTQSISPIKLAIHNSLFAEGAKLRNAQGEAFMYHYDPVKADLTTRDVMARAIWSEVNKGNGIEGGVYLDLSEVPTHAWNTSYHVMWQFLDRFGFDVNKRWLIVSPAVHFFMGGVKIDPLCQTGVHGLYVAGEGAGGLHGANRLPGNALNEAVVFGAIAGQQASAYACQGRTGTLPKVSIALAGSRPARESTPITEIRKRLQRSMWEGASIVRSRDSLLKVQSEIQECRKSLMNIVWRGARDLAAVKEVEGMCTTAEILVASALKREESRGSHFRADCPSMDDAKWFGNIEITKRNGDLTLNLIPIPERQVDWSNPL
jgi:succinate dehydrogenase/fumarate reductase flavoprotein subunit